MDHDDTPIGRVLTRREILHLFTAAGATLLTPTGALPTYAHGSSLKKGIERPSCIVKPEMTEGPYFADSRLMRSDIRSEPTTNSLMPGSQLSLEFVVAAIRDGSCSPLPGAIVDIWQCDAQGAYSAFQDNRIGFDTRNQTFLRGYQHTNEQGIARFTTIYPGWYPGRAVHIHFKIRTDAVADQTYEFTSQLFFDEALTDQVHALDPYASNGTRDTPNAKDGIYRNAGGEQLLLSLNALDDGHAATFSIGLDLSDTDTGRPDGFRRRGRGGRP